MLDNQNLQQLGSWVAAGLTIPVGKIYFAFNPRLCLEHIYRLEEVTGTRGRQNKAEINPRTNGDRAACETPTPVPVDKRPHTRHAHPGEGCSRGDSLRSSLRGLTGNGMPRSQGGRSSSWQAWLRAGPSSHPGQTRTLRFVSNVTEADRILLRWERYEPLEARDLLSFIVYYKES